MDDIYELEKICRLVRYLILKMTTTAGSGHMTSSMSAVELMVALYFSKLRFDLKKPKNIHNDRVIFSKGHATPLLYSLYCAAGEISEKDLMSYRKFGSKLEGHPMPSFPYVDVATGSLGQGLSAGVGMAIASRKLDVSNLVFVLLGDSEMAEGSVWEAMNIAACYQLDNLVAIIDVNRLGQRGETMLGWNIESYKSRAEAFGWEVYEVDGHDLGEIAKVYRDIVAGSGRPKMIIAKTIKGKGVPFAEDKEDWHARVLDENELKEALFALGDVDFKVRGQIAKPEKSEEQGADSHRKPLTVEYSLGDDVMTRKAYGEALSALGSVNRKIVSLDGEVKNSTFANDFEEKHSDRFFEMYVAEQNMVGTAAGMSKLGFVPFVSTFSAFFTRAHDQIRMAAYSGANVKFVGSHSGVSIGADGPSQMGLEEVAMFRTVLGSTVFFPSDAVSCAKLVELAAQTDGIFYIGTLRPSLPVIYRNDEQFKIGGSKILRESKSDKVVVVAFGFTVHEALKAYEKLKEQGVSICVIDAYSLKPIDAEVIGQKGGQVGKVITVEDQYPEGGLFDTVCAVFARSFGSVTVDSLAVSNLPVSGTPEENIKYQNIDSAAIVKRVKELT